MTDEKDDTEPMAILVVLGMDAEGKPHASRFTPADSEQAVRAARMMNFHAVNVGDSELQKVAEELPIGRIFATGKGLVPFVKRDLYDKLAVLVGTAAEVARTSPVPVMAGSTKAGDGKSNELVTARDESTDPWESLHIGSTVLAKSVEAEEGWYEAIISSIAKDGKELTLRWRDYTTEPVFKRQRRAVAVLP